MGCFSQVNEDILHDLDVDVVLGNKDKTKIVTYIKEAMQKKNCSCGRYFKCSFRNDETK